MKRQVITDQLVHNTCVQDHFEDSCKQNASDMMLEKIVNPC